MKISESEREIICIQKASMRSCESKDLLFLLRQLVQESLSIGQGLQP